MRSFKARKKTQRALWVDEKKISNWEGIEKKIEWILGIPKIIQIKSTDSNQWFYVFLIQAEKEMEEEEEETLERIFIAGDDFEESDISDMEVS